MNTDHDGSGQIVSQYPEPQGITPAAFPWMGQYQPVPVDDFPRGPIVHEGFVPDTEERHLYGKSSPGINYRTGDKGLSFGLGGDNIDSSNDDEDFYESQYVC